MTVKINMYLGDSEKAVCDMPEKYYDLAIPDPQYGIGATKMNMGTHTTRKGDGYPGESIATVIRKTRKNRLNSGGGKLKNRVLNTSNCEWDEKPPPKEYFEQLLRISKNQIIWGGNYFADMLPASRCWLCWNKLQPWENFSQFELAWTSFDCPAAMFQYSNTGGANKEKKIHPTQKPLALYKWKLEKFAKPGWKLLDTHGGSGTAVIACIEMGLDIDWWEKDKYNFDNAVKRVKHHNAQLDMFKEQAEIIIHDKRATC